MNLSLKIILSFSLAILLSLGVFIPDIVLADQVLADQVLVNQGRAKAKNKFQGMFALYDDNRAKQIPNYITEDFLLLAYSMIRKEAVADLEQTVLLSALDDFLEGLEKSLEKAGSKPDSTNRQFIALLKVLAQGDEKPKNLNKKTLKELELIRTAKGIKTSALWGYPMDYSQMKPRGAYTYSKVRKQYFQAMRYGSSVLFPVKESKATGITAKMADSMILQASALVTVVTDNPQLMAAYDKLDSLLIFNFGRPDDFNLSDFARVLKKEGKTTGKKNSRKLRKALFEYAKKHQRKPSIIAGLVDVTKLEKKMTPQDVLTGFRLFALRYSFDSAIFQDLVFPNVNKYKGNAKPFGLAMIGGRPVKGFPSALELMALVDSSKAQDLIKKDDTISFENYEKAYKKAKTRLASASGVSQLHLGLMNLWLGTNNKNHPDDTRKLTSMLSFWTYQRYIGVLYQKQSNTATAKGGISLSASKREGAYLEPALELYLALSHITGLHKQNTSHESWRKFKEILDRCILIAIKERNGAKLADSDEGFLNSLDLKLKKLTRGKDHPIVVDVHTEPSTGQVVEQAIGYPEEIVYRGAKGALFSHYEFKHPMDDRLDDESWAKLLQKGIKFSKTGN